MGVLPVRTTRSLRTDVVEKLTPTPLGPLVAKISELTKGLPDWAVFAIFGGVVLLLLAAIVCGVCCCCRRCRKGKDGKTVTKKKDKDGKLTVDVPALDAAGQGSTKLKTVQPGAAKILERQKLVERLASRGMKARQQEAGGTLGKLQFSISYDFEAGELTLVVIQAADLKAMDTSGTSDPFVKVYLLPNKTKYETRTIKKTLNPVFNDTFMFKVPYTEMASKTLQFEVYDYDMLSKHDQIGQFKVALQTLDLAETCKKWMYLADPDTAEELGDICFSLRFLPTKDKLEVNILEAKDLKKMDVGGSSDPYVKIEIFQGSKRIKKKKTSTKKHTLNPYYDETFAFDVAQEQLQVGGAREVRSGKKTFMKMLTGPAKKKEKVSMHITVKDYDRIGMSDPIGQVILGCNATGEQLKHWNEMLANPRRAVSQWHSLQKMPGED